MLVDWPEMGDAPDIRRARFAELSPHDLYALLRLRVDVFVVEQRCAYPELDGWDTDPGTVHLWMEDTDGQPLSYLRVLPDPPAVRIGRVCTAPPARGNGLASRLMAQALEVAAPPVVLTAQAHLRPWYERFGFRACGPQFVEDGIPHVPMRLEPATA